ncbi:H(+)/Cl(-) exchange transporter ClcA [Bradyrhizobium symbiodeficiens]|uniref:H(+)/Cl(-) exchange transporter ClcA n=1 Tax=Bradyrhizobium symbiodeficiens TaxID=1404367 RepID=A0A6G9A0I7_9BRAD|nr:H(+)/Cl(-) exchange transporter ClcA [Bradyrhizobium symbiodeficiens]QIP05814.1 H(+)/Cl(-) exchange transporter ClcA [Bradyrhizobium symbiodeficiens]
MTISRNELRQAAGEDRSLLRLVAIALVAGAIIGCVGAIFRVALEHADRLRDTMIAWAHGHAIWGFLIIVGTCAIAASVAAWMVRRFSPHASGSGIPHVEAVLHEQIPPAPFSLVPVKFFAGLLAIGSGLALGREGPTVQMGAGIAVFAARICRLDWADCRVLLAAGAGAGLATAFNAPIAGVVFVLEELIHRFDRRVAVGTLAMLATAIPIARLFLGDASDFRVAPLSYPDAEAVPLFFILGAVAGLLAIAYNRTLLAALAVRDRFAKSPVELRAGLIGASVGILAWFAPELVGGGDQITQRALIGYESPAIVALAFLIRFGLGPLSYAAGTPGGLFAPLLVLGAQSGLLFGAACRHLLPALNIQPEAFALVGMAAFFTGVVRSPLTGIVLVAEMTANVTMLLPMLGACLVAMLLPMLLRDPPIYDSLREHTLRLEQQIRERCGACSKAPDNK